MMNSSSLKNEFFIVLTLQGRVLRVLQRIQKLIADHYNLYTGKDYPELHITLDRVKKEHIEKVLPIVKKPFKRPLPL